MTDLHDEYCVVDDLGQLMGMPNRTYTVLTAAQATKDTLDERIVAIKQAAETAKERLDSDTIDGGTPLSANEKAMLREMVHAAQVNGHRTYAVMRRRVSAWQAVA